MRRPVMVIGLDGLDLRRLLPLVHAGCLPGFEQLLKRGGWATLLSVDNMTTGPTWATFATGCLPEKHGILHDFHHSPSSYRLEAVTGANLKTPPFWQLAGESGRRVVVLNVPMSFPVQPVNGVILAGIDAPSERAAGFEYPRGTLRQLRRAHIDYMIDCGLASYMQRGQVDRGWAAVERETEGRTAAAESLLAKDPWDLFVAVYSLPDVWQHYYWLSPPGSPGEQYIRNAYQLIDRHLQRLLALLPSGGTVIVCSDHGFGPLLGTRNAVNDWLEGEGLLRKLPVQRPSLRRRIFAQALAQLRRRVSFRMRQQLLASAPRLRRLVETELRIGDIDFAHTQVYAAMDHLELWINVAGRQPNGCVPASAYTAVCDQVIRQLSAWESPDGEPYIRRVTLHPLANTVAHGALPPDLRLTWNEQARLPNLHPLITGDHAPEGTLLIAGPNAPQGELRPRSLADVGPLALTQLGIPVPAWMDGNGNII